MTVTASFFWLRSLISMSSDIVRREFYNESANINNVRIEQFPDTLIAGMLSFKPAQLLQFDSAEKTDVDVKELFK
jgi:LemA protein